MFCFLSHANYANQFAVDIVDSHKYFIAGVDKPLVSIND